MPSKEYFNRFFRYEAETGKLFWKVAQGYAKPGRLIRSDVKKPIVHIEKQRYTLARVIWVMKKGTIPDGYVVDHINGDHSDNRLENLRAVSVAINGRNLKNKKNNKSGYPGVYFKKDKQRWCVEMWVSGKKHFLGYFDTFEAAKERRQAVQVNYGFHKNHGRSDIIRAA